MLTMIMTTNNSNSNGSGNGNGNSVYHRAKLLSPIFPWLFFAHALPVAHATPITSPSLLRGRAHPHSRRRKQQQPLLSGDIDGSRQQPQQQQKQQQERSLARTVQNYCGITWGDANSSCLRPCPDGEADVCDWGESCFADLMSCPSMTVLEGAETGLPPPQPVSLGGGAAAGGWAATTTTGGGGGVNTMGYTTTGGGTTGGSTPGFKIGAKIPPHCPSTTTNTINVGYYQSWAKYRSSDCHPQRASEIPVEEFGYTHLIYSFAGISARGELEPYNGIWEEVSMYNEFNDLKKSRGNGNLKTLIAVGGWNLLQNLFSQASSTPVARETFARSVVNFLQIHNFDGLDLDWEYPVTRQGTPADYDNYPLLVKAIREALDQISTLNKRYLLTMAIPVNPEKLDKGFNLKELSRYVDWFHLMSYDIHGHWDDVAGSNTDMEYITNTVENNILAKGVSGEQLVFGMASYGRSMILTEPSTCKTAGCPIDGAGLEGCSGEMGFSPYFELKERYVDTRRYESLLINSRTGSMEMIVEGNVFVTLDLEVTFETKREYYLSKCFRGQMWWAIDMIKDPPFGTTSQASSSTSNNNPPSLTPAVASKVDNALPTLSLQNAPGVMQDDAYCSGTTAAKLVPIEECSGFAFCQNGHMMGSVTKCSTGLIFDANMGICNWPSETNLCGFEFCPNKKSGYVPFEECTRFYYCKAGSIDGDIDVCPEGTLFDVVSGICNWASVVECNTMQPTPMPTKKQTPAPVTPNPTFGSVQLTGPPPPPNVPQYGTVATPPPTYGSVGTGTGATAANTWAASFANGDKGSPPVTAPGAPDVTANSAFADKTARLRFHPTDDTYVQENKPYDNFNDRFIVVDQDQRFDGLLRFYVQGLENRQVNYVKLRLFVSNPSSFGGNFYMCSDKWHEDVVTWDTVPSIIGNKRSGEPLAVVHGVLANDWIEVDLTGLVETDGPVSLRITSDSSDNVMYSSKENANRNAPELIVGVEALKHTAADAEDDIEAKDAPTVTNTFKIGPTDDAFVYRDVQGNNYGHHTDLKVDVDDGVKSAYLRFDFSRVNIAAVESARLRLYATDSSPGGGTFVTASDSNWNEDTITFDNAPPADGDILGTLGDVVKGQWYEMDVTSIVTENAPLTICILGSHQDRVMYSSKEGSHSAEIVLTLLESVPLVSQRGKVVELEPTDDATIVLQAPNSNFGTSEELRIALAGSGMQNFLLRFDASDIPRGEVQSAILRIYATNEDPAYGGTFVESTETHWDERLVTWNNAPSGDGQVLGSLMEVEYGSWYDVDVTTAVIGGSPVTFRVSSPHSSVALYGSKESKDHIPRMIVQYSPPAPLPEDYDIYIPTDDASILMDKENDNFGRDDQLKVDGYGGVYNTLLRFDVSDIEKGTVEKAVLRLYAVDGSPSGGTFVTTLNTEWSQHKVTWATSPAADGIILTTLGEVVPYRWYEIDLSDIVQTLGGEPLSIRVAPSHGQRCAYSSSEDRLGHLPQLMIKSDIFQGME